MDKKYTIKDIAKMAGVSKGTVDRVLHNRGKVSPTALEKINEVLNVINYEPNLIARNLKNTKVYRICVLLPDPEIDTYWLPCVNGIQDAITEFKAYSVIIETYYFNPESTKSFLSTNEKIIRQSPDAVLIAPLFHKETVEIIKQYDELEIIVNTFNNQVESSSIKSFVGQDLYKSGRVAASLMNLILTDGQIAIIHIDESLKNAVHMQEKEKGFRNYFDEKKLSDFSLTTLKLKYSNIETKFPAFVEENPNLRGIFITTSKAYQIASVLSSIENRKIALIGYDLIEKNVNFLNQGLVHFLIHQNQKRQAYLGVSTLVEHFLFRKEIPETILLPIDIINVENASFYVS
ncbi:transcriptional regulator, LacI family [Flavobacterium aquidurense]|uniref:LacI family transcriptional regulator n=1 Tax=Flavobacterium frigidimaris TaxID=262320 RepID=A0ABX4BNG8_FLAFR|nr:LacI family DNA-binding transcriptional regulator [Flavobacterium frigidimaris]OXA78195.1 LacI family transcriptional regulator [Flavobacterium frigidimaris]SDY30229.1 transcriptional regulator, LacI family [Flavobacterium aquidurense]